MTEVGSVQAKREACEGFHNPGPQRPGPSVPGGQLPSRDICKCLRGPQLARPAEPNLGSVRDFLQLQLS